MRIMATVIFFSIFFAILGLLSFYVFIRGLQAIPQSSILRTPYIYIYWFIALSFIGGRLLERRLPSFLADPLIWIGSFWLGALRYFLLAVVFLDLLRLANHFVPLFPVAITSNYNQSKFICASGVFGLVGLCLLGGYINSVIPRIEKLDLSVSGKSSTMKSLNIVAASDIHMGVMVGRSRVDHIVDTINSLNPDIVLLPGDIVDEDLTPVIKQNLGEAIRNIKSRFGTYSITGNHEYIGGVEKACAYLTDHGVTVLRDESIKIGDAFFLVGREDRSISRFSGQQRKGLNELLALVDKSYPVILMDHQPFGLEEAANQGISLQLSGHTHYGQLWPLNYIVNSIYELAWGHKRIGDTHFYVSSGVGTWGPPMRIGNHPEIVNIRLNLQ
jgi:predicted MPP superfamily phosphohydrolase